ncbi:viridiflorene synthase-like [Camellia sinensis]|uniref:viridiflorene synthase-like n=1 Tax=Camellia sinensis TaxID=4442 RepID=UPI0010367F8E|nr:viridiflorene synthase-like [Camellia sinensis]
MASSQVGDMVNGNAERTRHLAKFPPSLWGDRFTSFTLDKQLWDKYGNEIEVLKEQVRSMVVAGGRKAAEQMNLINVLERLGVSYHFEKEIEEQLEQLFAKFEDNEDYDLFNIALHFRIFRQHGYKMSCDVFNKFRDSNGEFKETVSNDVQGMLSLYEATYLKIRGEGFLDEAHAFTIAQLESLVGGPHLSSDLSEQVMHALKQSIHRGFPRLEAKHFISFYEKDASRNETLLRLAKLDFNQLQLSHREELCHIFRWWKELDLTSKVPYARDRAVECFFWTPNAYYEPQHSVGRAVLTKIMLLLSVTDDTYDAYGTYDELKLYTNAVQRYNFLYQSIYLSWFYLTKIGRLVRVSRYARFVPNCGKLQIRTLLDYFFSSSGDAGLTDSSRNITMAEEDDVGYVEGVEASGEVGEAIGGGGGGIRGENR